jgi:hypothetical protein
MSLLRSVQTGSEARPPSLSIGYRGLSAWSLSGRSVKLTTYVKNGETIPPLIHVSSWRGP